MNNILADWLVRILLVDILQNALQKFSRDVFQQHWFVPIEVYPPEVAGPFESNGDFRMKFVEDEEVVIEDNLGAVKGDGKPVPELFTNTLE